MNPKLSTNTTTGSTLRPGLSSVYNLSIVPELPPAPALLVDVGRAFLTVSLWSAAARLRIAARGPPGGEFARAIPDEEDVFGLDVDDSGPDSGPEVNGEEGRGEALKRICQLACNNCMHETTKIAHIVACDRGCSRIR